MMPSMILKDAMEGMLSPEMKEEITGTAEITGNLQNLQNRYDCRMYGNYR